MAMNLNCDGSGPHTPGIVKKLPLGGGANLLLCHACWSNELRYRRVRNFSLGDSAYFDLPKWEDAEVYE